MKNIQPETHKKRALIIDDHRLFADAFSMMIERSDLFNETVVFYEIEKLLNFLKTNNKEDFYLFADYYLKERNITAYLPNIKRFSPQTNIIIVSSLSNPLLIKNLLQFPIQGILGKSSKTNEIFACFQSISQGSQYISSDVEKSYQNLNESNSIPFSSREVEVLTYFAQGLSVEETAKAMFLSKHTIVAHRRKMMAKTNCNNIIELLNYARKLEII